MVRHSKNNTASSAFTKAEYGKLNDVWGSKSVQVGADSMRHFDQCNICLNTADAPVTCDQGHLYCKECILTSLLEQKQALLVLKSTLERLEKQHEHERVMARQKAIAQVQMDFERIHQGINSDDSLSRKRQQVQASGRRQSRSPSPSFGESSRQRHRSRSPISKTASTSATLEDMPRNIAAQSERTIEEALSRLERQQALDKRSKLPAYWLPSLTPSASTSTKEAVRQTNEALSKGLASTKCFARERQGHEISIKSLIDVKFVLTTSEPKTVEQQRKLCPSCKKVLSDVHTLFVLRRCGHVHCSTCVEDLLKPAIKRGQSDKQMRAQCLECSAIVKSAEKDLIALQREGTGFAFAGNNEIRKKGVAFQG